MALFDDMQRVKTGVLLLVGVLFIGFVDSFFLTWFTLGGVYILAFRESLRLYGLEQKNSLIYATILWLLAYIYPYADDLFILSGLLFAGIIAYNRAFEWREFAPFIYPTAGMLYILTLYQSHGMASLLWLLVVVALSDIGAYAVGKSIGKSPFSPTSPKKTLEGVAGGVVIATLGGMFLGTLFVDLFIAMIISFAVALSAVFGDLFESYLKRQAGVKDSGTLLPGHGGVLDRIDGYLFGGVVMLVLLRGLV